MQLQSEIIIQGKPLSKGIAIGKPFFVNRHEHDLFIPSKKKQEPSSEQELIRYRDALLRSKQDIKRLQKQLEMNAIKEDIPILETQLELLQDPYFTVEIENEIKKSKQYADAVFHNAIKQLEQKFRNLNNRFFLERFKDLEDISKRVMSYLQESGYRPIKSATGQSIICATELTASEIAEAITLSMCAVITEKGSSTSHATILAKSSGMPYITNINLNCFKEHTHTDLIIDGKKGIIILYPSKETLHFYQDLQKIIVHKMNTSIKQEDPLTQTADGFRIQLLSNLDLLHEMNSILKIGSEGIGLFRSEYLVFDKHSLPSEEDQIAAYTSIAEKIPNKQIVIRTFDFAKDKLPLCNLQIHKELCSYEGHIARFLIQEKNILKQQIKAILKSNKHRNIHLLFPMVSSITEWRLIKELVNEAKVETGISDFIPLGCMIEVPSTAILIDHFAKECDFLSIGTNDLIQYTLATNRLERQENEEEQATDPSILKLIKMSVNASNQAKIPLSLCGAIASDLDLIPLLIGLGVKQLSVPTRQIPKIKAHLAKIELKKATELANHALELATSREILTILQKFNQDLAQQ